MSMTIGPMRSSTRCGSPSALDRLVALEIEEHVAHRVAERERRVLLRPLPLDARSPLGDLGLVPAVLEDDERLSVCDCRLNVATSYARCPFVSPVSGTRAPLFGE